MRVIVTGAKGQLGSDVLRELEARGHEALGFDKFDMDVTDKERVNEVFSEIKPEAVIHCAGFTSVDEAEDENISKKAYAINAGGTINIAEAAKKLDCKLLYISTDYVFGGNVDIPHQPDDKNFEPLSVYAASKLEGEQAVSSLMEKFFIVRISWVFGLNGKNFVKTMLKLSEKHESLRVVKDQIGTPTYTVDVARLLVDMIETEEYGFYHATNEGGYISWAQFSEEIFKLSGKKTLVVPVTTEEYGLSVARRPFNSRLDTKKLAQKGFKPLPPWQDALARFLKELEVVQWVRLI